MIREGNLVKVFNQIDLEVTRETMVRIALGGYLTTKTGSGDKLVEALAELIDCDLLEEIILQGGIENFLIRNKRGLNVT